MNSQIKQEIDESDQRDQDKAAIEIGETLPLFELSQIQKRASHQQRPRQVVSTGRAPNAGRNVNSVGKRANTARNGVIVPDHDRHMHVAWQLSKALKAVKTGRKSGREMAKLTPNQRHQVGNAICEHLLASLRQQVHSESRAD